MKLFMVMVSILSFGLSQCAKREMSVLMDAALIAHSTSKRPSTKLIKGKYVEVKWCYTEKKYADKTKGPGPVDQLIAKGHKLYKSRYFMDVTFYDAGLCTIMRGFTTKLSGEKKT